jgi:ferredoxin-thioredoxin reductase catalytic subunit
MISIENVMKRAENDAKTHGFYLTPDPALLQDLLKGLQKNEERYGYPSCPCRLASGKLELDRDIICPCDYRNPDIEEYGQCYCALYVRKDVHEGKTALQPIRERRPANKQSRAYKIHNKPAKILIKKPGKSKESSEIKMRLYYCKQCGYICFREDPPYICPICKAKEDMFSELSLTTEIHEII